MILGGVSDSWSGIPRASSSLINSALARRGHPDPRQGERTRAQFFDLFGNPVVPAVQFLDVVAVGDIEEHQHRDKQHVGIHTTYLGTRENVTRQHLRHIAFDPRRPFRPRGFRVAGNIVPSGSRDFGCVVPARAMPCLTRPKLRKCPKCLERTHPRLPLHATPPTRYVCSFRSLLVVVSGDKNTLFFRYESPPAAHFRSCFSPRVPACPDFAVFQALPVSLPRPAALFYPYILPLLPVFPIC